MTPDRKAMLVWGQLLKACNGDALAANRMVSWFVAGDEQVARIMETIERDAGVARATPAIEVAVEPLRRAWRPPNRVVGWGGSSNCLSGLREQILNRNPPSDEARVSE